MTKEERDAIYSRCVSINNIIISVEREINMLQMHLDMLTKICENESQIDCKAIGIELQTIRCPKCGRIEYIRDMEKDMGIKGSYYKYKCINCNTYIKDELQTEGSE